jgi:cellulose biosynthesis protein BcsE
VLAITESAGEKTLGKLEGTAANMAAASAPAQDAQDVFFMDSTLVGISKNAPGKWTHCDSLVGLMHSSRKAVAAAAILVFDRSTDLRQLAQAVHTLRTSLGKQFKIIIRELDASLRYQNELLLLRLGANLVLHRDVPVARLQLAIQSLAGQVFNREVDVNFEHALASVSASHGVGYVQAAQFCQQVVDIVERSKALAIPYAMIRAKVPKGVPLEQSVARFRLTRNGDMVTATHDEVFLFLSACPQASLLPTLKRVAGDSFESDFPDMRFAVQEAAVTTEIAELAQLAKAGRVPALTIPTRDRTATRQEPTGTGTRTATKA